MGKLKLHLAVVGLFLLKGRQSDCGCDFNPDDTDITLYTPPTLFHSKDECITSMGYIGSANYPNNNPPEGIMESCYLRSNDSNHENITVTITILLFNQFVRQGRHYLTVSALSRSDCQSTNTSLHIEVPETHAHELNNDITYMETVTADIIHVQYAQQQRQDDRNGGYYMLGFESEQNILVTCDNCTGDNCLDFNHAVCTPPSTELTPTTESFQNSTNREDGFPGKLVGFAGGGSLLLVIVIITCIIIIVKRSLKPDISCTVYREDLHEEADPNQTEEHAEKDKPLDKTDTQDIEDYSYATTTPYKNHLFHENENNRAGNGKDTTQTSGSCEYSEIMIKQTANGRHSKDSNKLVMEDNQHYGM